MQRVISYAEQRLCNGKNQEKTALVFFQRYRCWVQRYRFFFNGIVAGSNGTVARWNGTVVGATGDK